jgi:hypothetical protein
MRFAKRAFLPFAFAGRMAAPRFYGYGTNLRNVPHSKPQGVSSCRGDRFSSCGGEPPWSAVLNATPAA